MKSVAITPPTNRNFAVRAWHWLRAVEQAMDQDPADALRHRVATLESRIAKLETAQNR